MEETRALLRFMRLMESVPQETRRHLINGDVNDDLTAIAVGAAYAASVGDTNALRTAIDTAFCMGVLMESDA